MPIRLRSSRTMPVLIEELTHGIAPGFQFGMPDFPEFFVGAFCEKSLVAVIGPITSCPKSAIEIEVAEGFEGHIRIPQFMADRVELRASWLGKHGRIVRFGNATLVTELANVLGKVAVNGRKFVVKYNQQSDDRPSMEVDDVIQVCWRGKLRCFWSSK